MVKDSVQVGTLAAFACTGALMDYVQRGGLSRFPIYTGAALGLGYLYSAAELEMGDPDLGRDLTMGLAVPTLALQGYNISRSLPTNTLYRRMWFRRSLFFAVLCAGETYYQYTRRGIEAREPTPKSN